MIGRTVPELRLLVRYIHQGCDDHMLNEWADEIAALLNQKALKRCQARQHSDQMVCARCGLIWNMNDPDPPVCPRSA